MQGAQAAAALTLTSAVCAATLFSSLPIHVTMAVFCRALPYEKERCHGRSLMQFIAFRLIVAVSSLSSSSAVSPERKKMPARSCEMVWDGRGG